MRGKPENAAERRLPAVKRRRLSDEEEEWIARQLETAPPLTDSGRRRIEQLLALPPDNLDVVRVEVRAS